MPYYVGPTAVASGNIEAWLHRAYLQLELTLRGANLNLKTR